MALTIETVTVTGVYHKSDGSPESGSISVRLAVNAVNLISGPHEVTIRPISLVLDQDGAIRTQLYPSDSPGWMLNAQIPYKVHHYLSGSRESYYVYILPPGPVDLSTLPRYTRNEIVVPRPLDMRR